MSGGSFEYAYCRVDDFAADLKSRLDNQDKINEWGEKPNSFEPTTIATLRAIEQMVRFTASLMKEVEWLYSGDTSDNSFMKNVAEIVPPQFQNKPCFKISLDYPLNT